MQCGCCNNPINIGGSVPFKETIRGWKYTCPFCKRESNLVLEVTKESHWDDETRNNYLHMGKSR